MVQGMETWRQDICRSQENKGITANADTVKGLQVWAFLEIGNRTSEVLRFLYLQPSHNLHTNLCLQFLDQFQVISGLGITQLAMLRLNLFSLEDQRVKQTSENDKHENLKTMKTSETLDFGSFIRAQINHPHLKLFPFFAAPDPPGSCKQRLGQSEEGTLHKLQNEEPIRT